MAEYIYYKVNELIRRKATRGGTHTKRGWAVYPKINRECATTLFGLTEFNPELSFKQNYKNNHKVILKWVNSTISFN